MKSSVSKMCSNPLKIIIRNIILWPGASPQAACSVGEHGATRTPLPQHRAPDHYDDDGGDDDDDDDNDDNNCDDDNDDNMVMVHQEWGSICESRWKFSSWRGI